jgi:hypothetical protein
MTESEYKDLESLGFKLSKRVNPHEGCFSRFLLFDRTYKIDSKSKYQYLEFVELTDPSASSDNEGLSFAPSDFRIFDKGVAGFNVIHKNFDWYDDKINPTSRDGWNFACPIDGFNESFFCWVTQNEKDRTLDGESVHPNTCFKIHSVLFNSETYFERIQKSFLLSQIESKVALEDGVELSLNLSLNGSKSVLGAIVIEARSLETFKKFAKGKYKEISFNSNQACLVELPNHGFHIMVIERK